MVGAPSGRSAAASPIKGVAFSAPNYCGQPIKLHVSIHFMEMAGSHAQNPKEHLDKREKYDKMGPLNAMMELSASRGGKKREGMVEALGRT